MPLIIGDDGKVTALDAKGTATNVAATYSPKFFHKNVLTGKGGTSRGLLNENNDPKMFPAGYPMSVNPRVVYGTSMNKDIKTYNIPCFLITPDMWDFIDKLDRPDIGELSLIASDATSKIYLSMPIHALQIDEYESISVQSGTTVKTPSRDLAICTHMFLYRVADDTVLSHTQVDGIKDLNKFNNTFYHKISHNMFTTLRDVESTLTGSGYTVDRQAMNDFVQNYSVYTELCKASKMWQTETAHWIADVLVKSVDDYYQHSNALNDAWVDPYASVSDVLSRLEKYSVSLDQYLDMYEKMRQTVHPEILAAICKSNLNLRLANTLRNMNDNRASLPSCPNTKHAQSQIPYSTEQLSAIESTSPLTLIQSGAGSGKSTVILGRIDHMIANGIDPNDITVLSFTNAAADHITDLKPSIHSMTIASMLHKIYNANFPTHQLSSLSTIINSLDIFFGSNSTAAYVKYGSFVSDFKSILERLRDNNEYTRANNFVEDNLDMTIDVLNIIEQTSLELESIICYQKMDTLVEPADVKTKHLIIDEVQDNSIAEFIYSIRYVDKHKCSMYIVGDCSQTLYEFRSSNPKALNILEGSGVFETHKLQTNYRSNQEILDFANVLLGNIEANQYANIQLRANSLKPVTAKSFKDAVTFMYTKLPNKSNPTIESVLSHSITFDTKAYINDKLQKGEQVCILAPQRYILSHIERALRIEYPNASIASLVPRRQYDSVIFSKFIAKYWSRITFTPPAHVLDIIEREILSNLVSLTPRRANAKLAQDTTVKMLAEFRQQHSGVIANWENQVMMSVMPVQQMLDEIKKLMLSYEIKKNAAAQAVLSSKNAQAKKASDVNTANFVISTIHSAKGLEFDNVIIYYLSESESTIEESTKRMYYVALTRAKNTEFIFAYDTHARPKIQGDYEKIIKTLTAKDAKNAANASAATTTAATVATEDPDDAIADVNMIISDPESASDPELNNNDIATPSDTIPNTYRGHMFTNDERLTLLSGGTVYCSDLIADDGTMIPNTGLKAITDGSGNMLIATVD